MKKKLFIVTTVPISFIFFKGQVSFLKREFDIELISSSGKQFIKACEEEKVKGHIIEMKRDISIFKDILSLIKLIQLFSKTKPDIVHGNTPKGGLLSMIAAWLIKTPTRIYYIHGLRYEGAIGLKKSLLLFMEKLSCYFATDIFAVSNGVKQNLILDKITNRKINIINNGSINGIDTEYFSATNTEIKDIKSNYNINNTDFVYGFVGRLVKDKGINELIKAFMNINSKNKNTKLILVGAFEDKLDPLNSNIKNKILNNKNIIHVGFQSDIRPFLKMMHVFVFPSYREGFGISIMEAAAMNLPVIASNIIGCNEIIKDNYNGILINPKSELELKNAMELTLNSKEMLYKMSTRTRGFIIEKYEQKLLWKNTLQAYKAIYFNKN